MARKRRLSEIARHAGGAVLMGKFSRARGRSAKTKVGNATPRKRRHRHTKRNARQKAGAVSMEEFFQPRWKNVRQRVGSSTLQKKQPTNIRKIASRVGAASKDAKEKYSFKPPRPIVRPKVVSVSIPKKKRPSTIV